MTAILAADLGGTNSRFAYFTGSTPQDLTLVDSIRFSSKEVDSFAQLVDQLRQSDFSLKPEQADIVVIAAAGPIEREVRCKITNVPWAVDIANAREEFGFSHTLLINDFVAQAFACRSPVMAEARDILTGEVAPRGTVAVMGAGTGLGYCALLPIPGPGDVVKFAPVPSEGGQAYFPFLGEKEFAYQRFIRETTGRDATGDVVVTGLGLRLVHHFLTGEDLEPKEVGARILQQVDKDGESPTLRWFARFYGRACRDYSLKVLATGGLFISGGIAAKLPLVVEHPEFAQEFRKAEKLDKILARIPVRLNVNEDAGLWGSALCGAQALT